MAVPTAAAATAAATTPANIFGLSSMAAGLGTMAGDIFGYSQWQNPGDAANQYLSQIADTITPYYKPYIRSGKIALPSSMSQYLKLIKNPAGFMNQIGSQFQQSPGYQYQVEQATNAANNAAAASGMVGSPQEQQQLSQNIMGMANQDYYNFLDHVLGIYKGGLQGLTGRSNLGYQAASGLSTNLAQALEAQAAAAYAGTAAQNQAEGGLISDVTSVLF